MKNIEVQGLADIPCLQWARSFNAIDSSKVGAKAFTGGRYLNKNGVEGAPVGTLILCVAAAEPGGQEASFYRLMVNGKVQQQSKDMDWRLDWSEILRTGQCLLFREMGPRAEAESIATLSDAQAAAALDKFASCDLVAALRSRGYKVSLETTPASIETNPADAPCDEEWAALLEAS